MEISEPDKLWIKENYPDMHISVHGGVSEIVGLLKFQMFYNKDRKNFVLNPTISGNKDEFLIKDLYKIQILTTPANNSTLPQVRETGGRILSLARRLKKPIEDLHCYADAALCLCARQAEIKYFPEEFSLRVFIQELVVPFLYSNSFFERNGYRPWGEYGHSTVGTLQYYVDQGKLGDKDLVLTTLKALNEDQKKWAACQNYLQKISIPNHAKCVCGSNKRMDKCHPDALLGLRKLKNDLALLEIYLEDLN